jgi:aspartate aminotransferase
MADRINGMRAELKTLLVDDLGSKQNWDHISACFARVLLTAADARSPTANQIGMFAFLGSAWPPSSERPRLC